MKLERTVLAVIGRRLPAIVGAHLRLPSGSVGRDRPSETRLNPQPLPPGPPPEALGAALADEFIRTAWLAERFGQDGRWALDVLDDWCPTVPKKIKLPPWWPPIPEPEPGPDWFVDYHIGFASHVAAASAEFGDTALGAALARVVDRSLQAIGTAGGHG